MVAVADDVMACFDDAPRVFSLISGGLLVAFVFLQIRSSAPGYQYTAVWIVSLLLGFTILLVLPGFFARKKALWLSLASLTASPAFAHSFAPWHVNQSEPMDLSGIDGVPVALHRTAYHNYREAIRNLERFTEQLYRANCAGAVAWLFLFCVPILEAVEAFIEVDLVKHLPYHDKVAICGIGLSFLLYATYLGWSVCSLDRQEPPMIDETRHSREKDELLRQLEASQKVSILLAQINRQHPPFSPPLHVAGTQVQDGLDTDSSCCGICFEDMAADTADKGVALRSERLLQRLSCDHTFHHECLSKWFRSQWRDTHDVSCPTCRREVIS